MTSEQNKELSIWETTKLLFGASRAFWLVNMVNFFDGIAYFGILTLLTTFLTDRLGMSDKLTGISVSTYTGLVTLFMFGGGFLSDKLGVRRALGWSLFIIGLGRLCLTAAPMSGGHTAHLIAWLGLFLMSFGTGVLQPALYAGIKEYTDPRTATIGYGVLYSIMNLGIVAENFMSPFFRTSNVFLNLGFTQIIGLGWGIDGVFWMITALTGAVLFLHLTLFSKKIEQTEKVVENVAAPETKTTGSWREKLQAFPLFDPRFMFFIFILLPVRTLFAHQFLTMPAYVFRCFPESVNAKFEWISGLNPLIIVVFVPLIAAFTRKARVVDMMIIGTTVTALTTFLLVPGPNLAALLGYVILFSFGEALWSSRFLEYVAQLAPAGKIGAYMGLAGIPWFLAKFTTGLYSGTMLERFMPKAGNIDSSTLWLIYGIIACISPVGLIIGRKWIIGQGTEKVPATATPAPSEA